MCTCVFGQFEPDKNTFFFFRKKKEKKGKKKMEGKLSPPMARLIFRAVLARTKSRGVSQQVRLYEFVQSNKVCLARDTYDPPFSSSATKQWNIHRINMYTHTRQNFKNRSVFFFFFALPTRWKYYSPYFFLFSPLFPSLWNSYYNRFRFSARRRTWAASKDVYAYPAGKTIRYERSVR